MHTVPHDLHQRFPAKFWKELERTNQFALDLETVPPEGGKPSDAKDGRKAVPTLMTLSTGTYDGAFDMREPECHRLTATLLQDSDLECIIHNTLFDLVVLHTQGIQPISGIRCKIRDSMILQFMLDENEEKGLKTMASTHLRRRMATYDDTTVKNPKFIRKSELENRIKYYRQLSDRFDRMRPWPNFDSKEIRKLSDIRKKIQAYIDQTWPGVPVTDDEGNTIVNKNGSVRKKHSPKEQQERRAFREQQDELIEQHFGLGAQLAFDAWVHDNVVMPSLDEIETLTLALHRELIKYAKADARATLDLWNRLRKKIAEQGLEHWLIIECENRRITTEASCTGIPADVDYLKHLKTIVDPLIEEFEGEVANLAGGYVNKNGEPLNPNSPDQLRECIFLTKNCDIPVFRRLNDGRELPRLNGEGEKWLAANERIADTLDLRDERTIPRVLREKYLACDAEVLERISDPIGMAVLNLRTLTKLRGTYITSAITRIEALGTGRLLGYFNSIGTDTGRLSSSDPNLQNIPSRKKPTIFDERIQGIGPLLRNAFVASPGKVMIVADQSQIELRIITEFTGDPTLIDIYTQAVEVDGILYYTGDIHSRTANDLSIPRKLAKCLDWSTYVTTQEGTVPIGSILGELEPGDHRPIPKLAVSDARGGFVSTSQGLKRERRPTVHVVTSRGVVTCTKDHRWMTGRGLVEAKDLKPGDTFPDVELPRLTGSPRIVDVNPFTAEIGTGPAQLRLDERWAYFAGLYLGDGSMVNGHTMTVTHDAAPGMSWWRESIERTLTELGLPNSLSKDQRQTRIGSRVVARAMKSLELGPKKGVDIRIPTWVSAGGESTVAACLAGLFDTDGTVGDSASFTTRCPILAGQVSTLLRMLGCDVSLDASWNTAYKKFYYRVRVRLGSILRFSSTVVPYMRHIEKVQQLNRICQIPHRSHHKATEIKHVIDAGRRDVYDFHVDNDDHLYLQGGFLGHNNVNFGFNYGMGPFKFARQIRLFDEHGDYDLVKAKLWRDGFFNTYPMIEEYSNLLKRQFKHDKKREFKMLSGRKKHYLRNDDMRGGTILNHKVQGSSADLLKINMMIIDRHVRPICPSLELLFQVHDELGYQADPAEAELAAVLIKFVMEQPWIPMRVPVLASAKTCPSWAAKDDDNIPEIGAFYARIDGENRIFHKEDWPEYLELESSPDHKIELKSATAILTHDQLAICHQYIPRPRDVPELAPYFQAA